MHIMDRTTFHKHFNSPGVVVLPVIHALDSKQVEKNLRIVIEAGAVGAFLINHDFPVEPFLPIVRKARACFPGLWLGVNFLAVTGKEAFPILGELQLTGTDINAYWADDARIDERCRADDQPEADEIASTRAASGWKGLYFGGTAFKKQREIAPGHYETSAAIAAGRMDVVTTSGIATGKEADMAKIANFRRGVGETALALASGVTPENAASYATDVDCFLVATGINHEGDFYNIDLERLVHLLQVTRALGAGNGGG